MSDRSKLLVGSAVAVLIALALATTDLVQTPDEFEVLPLDEVGVPPIVPAPASAPASAPAPETASAGTDAPASAPVPSVAPAGAPPAPAPAAPVLAASTLRVAPDGSFVPNAAAAALFASYYAAHPNSSDELVRGHIVLALLDGLPARAADEAILVLDRWRAARSAELALGPEASAQARRAARDGELGAELARALAR